VISQAREDKLTEANWAYVAFWAFEFIAVPSEVTLFLVIPIFLKRSTRKGRRGAFESPLPQRRRRKTPNRSGRR